MDAKIISERKIKDRIEGPQNMMENGIEIMSLMTLQACLYIVNNMKYTTKKEPIFVPTSIK